MCGRPRRPASLLVVDDSPDDLHLFKRAVERSGCAVEVCCALGTAEGLAILDGTSDADFYLVVLDLRMPGVDGIEFLEELRKRPKLKWLPKVVFSTSSLDTDICAALEAGAQAYVQKPLDLSTHDAAVRAILDFWINHHRAPPSMKDAP